MGISGAEGERSADSSAIGRRRPCLKKGTAGGSAYNASKGGVVLLTRNVAIDYGRQGIRANAICPGLIKTDFASALWSDPKLLAYTLRKQAVNRLGEPDDISGLALFLCSDAASFCTGGVYMADGGYTI